jgi:succinate dehydrogenase / fumarate reductase cytochrome b subunit|tara:strand:+ start:321 stop:1181 length:861 start_codon:yes stop_codon:yes gene_type:complete
MMKYAYFPGCAAKATTTEANRATHAIAKHLAVELIEFPNFSCCGAGVLHEERPNLGVAINARNFAIAEREGLDIVTICNTCQLTMLKAKKTLDDDVQLRSRINRSLAEFDLEYSGKTAIRHLLWVLIEDLGLSNLQQKIERQLAGLNVAPFYGCHMLRPKELLGSHPDFLERLIGAVGANPVDYGSKTDCCGFHVMLVNQEVSVDRVASAMTDAKESGADLVVTPCTLCQLTLDSYQYRADKRAKTDINMPVIHLPQLIGLALGLDRKELGLDRHLVPLPEGLAVD